MDQLIATARGYIRLPGNEVCGPHPAPQVNDFAFANHGSLCILTPLSDAGKTWVDLHLIDEAALTWAGGVVIEPRYVEPIVSAIVADGLLVAAL